MDECNLWSSVMQHLRDCCSDFDSLWITRQRRINTQVMVQGLLHLARGSRRSYDWVLDQLKSESEKPLAASSYCEARSRFPAYIVREIRDEITTFWDEKYSDDRWHGFRLHAVDGTKVSLPRPLFDEGFQAPASGYCPQGLVSLLLRLDDRMICDIRLSSHENERTEACAHLDYLSIRDLVIYDRGYLSFGLLTAHIRQGVAAVFRVQKGAGFKEVETFWKNKKRETIVTIDPTPPTYRSVKKQFPEYEVEPIQLRLIKYTIGRQTYVLATTVLDQSIPANEFVNLYSRRWLAEETFKALKQTLELESFHSKSENGVAQEVEARALLWNLTQMLGSMAAPAIKKNSWTDKLTIAKVC